MAHKAFVSSTFLDLREHRAHVIAELRRAEIHVDPMEDWPADSEEPKQFSQDRIRGCDLCVLIVARKRGTVPAGERKSITQLEYEAALKVPNLSVLVFMLDDKAPWYSDHDERKTDPEVELWRAALRERHGVELFGLAPESIKLTAALTRWVQKQQQRTDTGLPAGWLERHLATLQADLADVAVPLPRTNRPRVLPLESVYVPLRLRMQQPSPETGDTSWLSLLRRERVALTGDAGSGKSTLLRYVALQAAMRLRKRTDASAPAPAMTPEPPEGESVRVPVLLDLATAAVDLLKDGEIPTTVSPERWLAVLAPPLRLTEAQLEAFLREGNVLFLFDGLDEVPDPRDRERIVDGIANMQGRFSPIHAQHHVIVACRTPAWGTSRAFTRFETVLIQPMDRTMVLDYLTKWTREVWGADADHILGRLERSLSSPAVGDIASNPQMSTLLALVEYDDDAPRQQALLFDYFVRKLTRTDERTTAAQQKATWSHLTALAVEMQRSTTASGEPLNALNLQKAEQLLGKRAQSAQNTTLSLAEVRERGEALLAQLEVATGLLDVEHPEGLARNRALVRFKHRTLQEYLAARHYAERALDELLEHVVDPGWSKVLAFTSGILTQIDEDAVHDFFERVLATPASANGDELSPETLVEWAPRVAAASVCLAELASYDLDSSMLAPARRAHDLVLPVFTHDRVDIRTRVRIAEGLGSIFDLRLSREPRWITVPAGPFVRGSELAEAWVQERPRSRPVLAQFMLQRWPVTVAEYRRFIEEARGYENDAWWSDDEGRRWRDAHAITAPAGWQQNRSKGNRPVTGASYWEARAFCRWFATVEPDLPDGWIVDLPTEAQWEKAARGGTLAPNAPVETAGEKIFPWGDDWDDALANCASTGLQDVVPVGLFPSGHSRPYGFWDMAGNTSERCRDGFAPYVADDAGDPACSDFAHGHVVRGGSFDSPPLDLRVTYRFGAARDSQDERIGFRCAAMPATP